MATDLPKDKANGYEQVAKRFMSERDPLIGAAIVREWASTLYREASVLDLGCGHGVPISQVLINDGFDVYGIDASPTLVDAFRARFPRATVACAAVEDSDFFNRTFDGVVAWGLMFLLPADVQALVIRKVAKALRRRGRFLFTSPKEAVSWIDALTGRKSISLGRDAYQRLLRTEGLLLVAEQTDEAENHFYFTVKG